MGMAYHGLLRLIRHHELAIASVTVIFWLSLYLFERSWANMLGLSLTLIVYLGGVDVPGRPPAPGPRGDRQSAGARTARGAGLPEPIGACAEPCGSGCACCT